MKKIALVLVFIILLLCGCSQTPKDNDKLKIVATNFSCYDFSRAVAGADAEITMLIPPGTDIHSFEPTALDIAKIKECDLFIYVGGESDNWVDKILTGLNKDENKVLNLFKKLGISNEHSHETDEHIWTSPEIAIKIVNLICDSLSSANNSETLKYKNNAEEYVKKIESVVSYTKSVVENAEHTHLVIADRFPLKYFTEFYSLKVTAAFSACDHETDIDLNTAAALIETVKKEKLSSIFITESGNRSLAEAIKKSTGAEILTLHSLQNISSEDLKNGETFVTLMHKNAEVLRKGLTLCHL